MLLKHTFLHHFLGLKIKLPNYLFVITCVLYPVYATFTILMLKNTFAPALVLLDVRVRTEMHAHTFSHWQLFNRLFLLFE